MGSHRRLTEGHRSPTEAHDPREIGLKEVRQSSVISASARLTEICRGLLSLGCYAPDTPPKVSLKKASLRSQSSVNSASARLTEVLEVLGCYAPETSPKVS
eukprot:29162-Pelagococcus_subviridis.AAC.1